MIQWMVVRESHFELRLWLFPPTMESQNRESAFHKALIYLEKPMQCLIFPLALRAENEIHHFGEMRFYPFCHDYLLSSVRLDFQ